MQDRPQESAPIRLAESGAVDLVMGRPSDPDARRMFHNKAKEALSRGRIELFGVADVFQGVSAFRIVERKNHGRSNQWSGPAPTAHLVDTGDTPPTLRAQEALKLEIRTWGRGDSDHNRSVAGPVARYNYVAPVWTFSVFASL